MTASPTLAVPRSMNLAVPTPANGNAKLLIVDDQSSAARLLGELLRTEGYEYCIAESGADALEQVVREEPDLVLLDVKMPGLDGFEVCRRIKNDPARFCLPVILVTALAGSADRVKGAQVGADGFITKPPDEDELLGRIRSLLKVHQLQSALETSNEQLQVLLQERTRQLEEATGELQALLGDKARFTPSLFVEPPPGESPPVVPLPERESEDAADVDKAALSSFKRRLMSALSEALKGRTDLARTPEIVSELSQRLAAVYEASDLRLPDALRQKLFSEVVDDLVGYGPIEPLLSDATVTEVMVNGPQLVYAERGGQLQKTGVRFDDDQHVMRVIDRIVRPLGRSVDRKSPAVDARLPDGSRVNAIIAPCALDGPSITIRKFPEERLLVEDLIRYGSLSEQMATFLEACVGAEISILVSGGTGSGKTTLLNVLSSFIPQGDRIVTIEDSAELQLHQEHVVRLEAVPADVDGSGEVPIRKLVKNALRMRPDRIVVGEVRGGEALDMLQAMNTGHDGSLTTIHSNSPRDSIARLEILVLMAGMELPLKAVRSQIASAIELIVQLTRLQDGSRKVVSITEVQGMEGEIVVLSDIFVFEEQGMEDGRVVGRLVPRGVRPKFSHKLELAGYELPPEVYMTPAQRHHADAVRERATRSRGRGGNGSKRFRR